MNKCSECKKKCSQSCGPMIIQIGDCKKPVKDGYQDQIQKDMDVILERDTP